MGPKHPLPMVLIADLEGICVALHLILLLPLDDCLHPLQGTTRI